MNGNEWIGAKVGIFLQVTNHDVVFYHILLTFIRSAWPMRHHRPTAGQPNPCIEFAKCQNDNPAIMRIAHFRPPAALTANNAVSRVRLLTF